MIANDRARKFNHTASDVRVQIECQDYRPVRAENCPGPLKNIAFYIVFAFGGLRSMHSE